MQNTDTQENKIIDLKEHSFWTLIITFIAVLFSGFLILLTSDDKLINDLIAQEAITLLSNAIFIYIFLFLVQLVSESNHLNDYFDLVSQRLNSLNKENITSTSVENPTIQLTPETTKIEETVSKKITLKAVLDLLSSVTWKPFYAITQKGSWNFFGHTLFVKILLLVELVVIFLNLSYPQELFVFIIINNFLIFYILGNAINMQKTFDKQYDFIKSTTHLSFDNIQAKVK